MLISAVTISDIKLSKRWSTVTFIQQERFKYFIECNVEKLTEELKQEIQEVA
jgi:hypothetical protein